MFATGQPGPPAKQSPSPWSSGVRGTFGLVERVRFAEQIERRDDLLAGLRVQHVDLAELGDEQQIDRRR